MAGAGFEPANSERPNLQSGAFDRSATPPGAFSLAREPGLTPDARVADRPASTSNSAYFGPPSVSPDVQSRAVVARRISAAR